MAGLIGPNGAGKTTAFNLLTGVYTPTSGAVYLNGLKISGKKPHEISKAGLGRTFQNIRLFKGLSVLENVLIAQAAQQKYNFWSPLFNSKEFQQQEEISRTTAISLLKIFHLDQHAQKIAGSLAYGEQRKLEIIRSLATNPSVLLLDEPAAGMNHSETHHLMETIAQIREEFALSILLIEHDMKLVMGICENIYVLDHGIKISEGSPAEIQKCPRVISAYLGTPTEDEVHP